MDDERFTRVKAIVCETLELDPDEVTETSLFVNDHGADSLNVIEIVAAMEKEYDVVIDDDGLKRMVCVRGVYEVVHEAAGWQPSGV